MVLNPNLSPEEELEKQVKFIAAIGKKKIQKTGCPLTDVENLVIRGMVEGKTYADQEMVSEYKKLLKNAGKKDGDQDSSEYLKQVGTEILKYINEVRRGSNLKDKINKKNFFSYMKEYSGKLVALAKEIEADIIIQKNKVSVDKAAEQSETYAYQAILVLQGRLISNSQVKCSPISRGIEEFVSCLKQEYELDGSFNPNLTIPQEFKIILIGSLKNQKKLQELFRDEKLQDILNIRIKDIKILSKGTPDDKGYKNNLVQEIREWKRGEQSLAKANLSEMDLWGCFLVSANLEAANLSIANLSFAELMNANLFNADLYCAVLKRAKLSGAILRAADLRVADLEEADMSGADLHQANLQRARLVRTVLFRANLHQANLQEADLEEADMSGADLHQANLQKATLGKTVLFRANLQEANLQEADLEEADMSGADLHQANLQGARLKKAKLSGANLRASDLQEADLTEAQWWQDAITDEKTKINDWILQLLKSRKKKEEIDSLSVTNCSSANLSGANLSNNVIREANFSYTDCSGANFSRATFRNINLSHANCSSADFGRATFRNVNLIGVNLRSANVKGTRFRVTKGLPKSVRLDLEQRGAIFEVSPAWQIVDQVYRTIRSLLRWSVSQNVRQFLWGTAIVVYTLVPLATVCTLAFFAIQFVYEHQVVMRELLQTFGQHLGRLVASERARKLLVGLILGGGVAGLTYMAQRQSQK